MSTPNIAYFQLPTPSFVLGYLQVLCRALQQEPTNIMVLVVNGSIRNMEGSSTTSGSVGFYWGRSVEVCAGDSDSLSRSAQRAQDG